MGRRGDGYGSEDHLRRYLAARREKLDTAVARSIGAKPSSIRWLDFPRTAEGDREFQRLEFLQGTGDGRVLDAWRSFWPTRGRGQTWDLVGRADETWLLVQAKTSWPEFVTSSCGAKGESLTTIRRALGKVKRDANVHRHFDWTGTYYQYANRLAALSFLRDRGVKARLIGIDFLGDQFPDGRRARERGRVGKT